MSKIGANAVQARRLRFIQDDHTPNHAVQLATDTWAVPKQAFEQLNRRGDYYRCVPIVTCDSSARCFFVWFERAVMFQHCIFTKHIPIDLRISVR